MAISKLILNGVIQMDVTGVTVEASNLLAPNTAVGADGQPVTGTMTEKVLTTKSITVNGTYDAEDDNADGYSSVTVNVPSSGASNMITGTFKGTTTGAAMDVNIPYTGSGYPIAFVICPTEGPYNSQSGSFHGLNRRYAIATYTMIKSQATIQPSYSGTGDADRASVQGSYKSSATGSSQSAFSGVGSSGKYIYNNIDASSTSSASSVSDVVKIRSKNKMSVYIGSSYYGFAPNIEYTYHIIYSS